MGFNSGFKGLNLLNYIDHKNTFLFHKIILTNLKRAKFQIVRLTTFRFMSFDMISIYAKCALCEYI